METKGYREKCLDLAEELGYFPIYVTLTRYLDLSPTKSCIFHYILSFSLNGIDEDGYCFSSRETMAKALNISKSTLDDNLKKLLDEKLIRRTKVVSHNHTYYSYTVDIKRIIDIIEKKKQQELKGISAQRKFSVSTEG